MAELQALYQIFLLPVVVLIIWTFLFGGKNSRFTKFVIEGGYMVLAIPILILTFIMVPFSVVGFWMNSTGQAKEITQLFVVITVALILIVEYFYIKRIITELQEKEQKPFMQIVKLWFDPKERERLKKAKAEKAESTSEYFDEIERMNYEKRKMDLEKKEKLKRALLNEYE